MPNIKKTFSIGAAVFLMQFILIKWIYPLFGSYIGETQQLFSVVTPATGIGGQKLGTTVLSYLGGLVPVSMIGWLQIAIGVFALMYAGFWLYESKIGKSINMDKTVYQRLFTILLYGHIALYIFFLILGWGIPGISVSLAIGLGLNLLIVSIGVILAAKYIPKYLKINWPKV